MSSAIHFYTIQLREDKSNSEMADISPEALYVNTIPGPVLHIKTNRPVSINEAVFRYTLGYARMAAPCLLAYIVIGTYGWFLITQVKIL